VTELRTSITISGFTRLFGGDLRRALDVARIADGSGIDQVNVADHVVMGDRTDRYPFGTFPYGGEEPWPEPLTLLAAMAGVTERVRLGTGIVITPLRPAVLLAKTVATLDQLSHGRVDFGVGIGWQREEYAASGVPWADRWQVFDDQLEVLDALWSTEPPVTLSTATVSFGPIWCEPRPVQDGGVPLWFGMAATDATVERIARFGIGWLPIHTTPPDEVVDGIDRLRAAFVAHGRDARSLRVRAAARPHFGDDGRLDRVATAEAAAPLAEQGITDLSFGLGRNLDDAAAIRRFVEDLGAAFS
jgi:probable F420-dependent oxidoreductase